MNKYRFLVFCVLPACAVLTLTGCKNGNATEPAAAEAQGEPFEIPAWSYATNYYFVDTSYRRLFDAYIAHEPPLVAAESQVVEEEVWVQRQGAIPDPNERRCVAVSALPSRPAAGYDTTVTGTDDVPGIREQGLFVRLNRSEYEILGSGYPGILVIRKVILDQYSIAIAYRRADGIQYGDFASDGIEPNHPVVLKMVRPKYLLSNGPRSGLGWDQLLKNVYYLGKKNIREVGFTLDIVHLPEGKNAILAQPLLRILGLDRYAADGTVSPQGDGVFDFRPGKTIDMAHGEVILPDLRPFAQGISTYFSSQGLSSPDPAYLGPAIYDTTQIFAGMSAGGRYLLKGRMLTW